MIQVLSITSFHRCYGMAIKSRPDCSTLYHDLGVSYHRQARLADKLFAKNLMVKAFQALERALQLDSTDHRHWNYLGLVALSKGMESCITFCEILLNMYFKVNEKKLRESYCFFVKFYLNFIKHFAFSKN